MVNSLVANNIIQKVIINGIDKNGKPYFPKTPPKVTESTSVKSEARINKKKKTGEISKKEPNPIPVSNALKLFFARYFNLE